MLQSVWGLPIVCYLFLGGLAGGLGSCSALAVICAGASAGRSVRLCAWLSFACVAVGTCFLLLDLGKPLRAMGPAIFMHADSWISRGVWIISAFAVVALVFLLLVSRMSSSILARIFVGYRRVRDALIAGVAWALLVCGCLLGLYTGFLLGGSVGVPFWQSPLLPPLFLASSLGAGMAVFGMSLALVERGLPGRLKRFFANASLAVTIAEGACLLFLVGLSWGSSDPAVHGAAETLLFGRNATVFWFCSVVPGYALALPLGLLSRRERLRAVASVLQTAECLCVLMGMFALRWCIVFSGLLVSA